MIEKSITVDGNNTLSGNAFCKIKKQSDWQSILSESFTRPIDLLNFLSLDTKPSNAHQLFSMRVPKPFAEKMAKKNINDPLLKQVLPLDEEYQLHPDFLKDPLKEQQFNPLQGLLHKYQSRVLLTLKSACAINCRYCFRRHFDYAENKINHKQLDEISLYIKQHPHVNEIILSGGDPLMAKDHQISLLIKYFESLSQIKRVRFHTRLPVVIPQRITQALIDCFKQTRLSIIIVFHINHPNEIDDTFFQFIKPLKEAHITLFNQSVLLKTINNDVDTLTQLSEKLFDYHILPYYLFCLDKVEGSTHFYIEQLTAKQLIKDVAEKLPGYLVPKLAKEEPRMKSKNMWI